MMDLLDENELSDISLDFSMEAEDSGIDACEARRRPIRSSDLESSTESDDDDADDEGENNLLMQHIPYRERLHFEENDRFGSKKHINKKLYAPKTAEQLERIAMMEETEDDQSIVEVELSASGEDDDSSVMELHIPLQKKLQKGSEFSVWQFIWKTFCCKSSLK